MTFNSLSTGTVDALTPAWPRALLFVALTLSAAAANSETPPLSAPPPNTQVVPVGDLGDTPRALPPAYTSLDAVGEASAAPSEGALQQAQRFVLTRFGGSRLLATGGISPLEGAGGGGIVPWALISGLGDRDQIGGSAYYTQVNPTDFSLRSGGGALGLFNRLELSFAHLDFGLGTTVPDHSIRLDVYGAKLRLFGDAVYDQDRWWPQLAAGIQHKQNKDYALVPSLLGARRADDNDYYLAATKVFLGGLYGRTVVANLTLRATRANQLGILGFGGDRSDAYRYVPEASLGVFLSDHWIIGGEYRVKPDNLSAFREDDFKDAFLVWLPTKRLSLTAAWAFLGNIANHDEQHALYLSGQVAF